MRKLFKDLFYKQGYEYDYVFDWMVKKPNPTSSITAKNEEEKQQENDADQQPNEGQTDNMWNRSGKWKSEKQIWLTSYQLK